MQVIDLTSGTYDDWIESVFGNPITSPIWYFRQSVTYKSDSTKSLQYLNKLFQNPDILLIHYELEQIEQGLWVICSSGGLLEEAFGDKTASISLKLNVVKNTYQLFIKVLLNESLHSLTEMWWDALTQLLSCQSDTDAEMFIGNNYSEIQDGIYKVLCNILTIDNIGCMLSALHGLGHLQYPGTSVTIGIFIEEHPDLDDEILDYARSCIAGEIL